MKVTFEEKMDQLPVQWDKKILKSGFLDTGGTADYACLTMCRVDVRERIIYVTGAMFWKVDEKDNVLFASIRNDIAKLHMIHNFDLMGCETNNYGRSEMESLRREYGIRMIGINTTGRVTNKKLLRKGESMDKEQIIKFTNAWRQHPLADPENKYRLGQIKFLKQKTEDLQRVVNELDNFVRKEPEGVGSTGRPKFGAEGSGHDDGPMSMLGNFHMIKTKVFKIYSGIGSVGAVPNVEHRITEKFSLPGGRSIGKISAESAYQDIE